MSIESLKAAATLVSEGAAADIWYDASQYGDSDNQALIDSVQEAMETVSLAMPKLLDALQEIEALLASHPEAVQGNSKVHYAMHKARAALAC